MSASVTPEVLWAQRSDAYDESKNIVYLTINAPDIPKDHKLELTSHKLSFAGQSKARKYAVELEFYEEIDEKESKTHHSGRGVEVILRKKVAKAEFWPRLLKEPKKVQFVKTDFDKWVDEDEQEDDLPDVGGMGDMGGMDMGGMGGMDMGGMGAMGAMGGMGGMGAMGAMGGMGDMGGFDLSKMMAGSSDMMGDTDAAGGGGDDDEMPELEESKPEDKTEGADDKKVEEVK